MSTVTPGYVFSSSGDPITVSKLNLLGSPSVSLSSQEVTAAAGSASGIGYATGTGGTVTQATSKSTGCTLNKIVGAVTMNSAALADATTVSFQLTNSLIAAPDMVLAIHSSAGTGGAYLVWADRVGSGSCYINVRNVSGGSLSEAIVLTVMVLKGATS